MVFNCESAASHYSELAANHCFKGETPLAETFLEAFPNLENLGAASRDGWQGNCFCQVSLCLYWIWVEVGLLWLGLGGVGLEFFAVLWFYVCVVFVLGSWVWFCVGVGFLGGPVSGSADWLNGTWSINVEYPHQHFLPKVCPIDLIEMPVLVDNIAAIFQLLSKMLITLIRKTCLLIGYQYW